jgi:hypothetical protein
VGPHISPPEANQPLSNRRRMEQPANSSESSRPDGTELATSRAEGGASASEHQEEERLDSEALIVAADRGELARVKEIIEGMKTNEVDINRQGSNGRTALIAACYYGLSDVALELLKVDGLDANVQDRSGYTALMIACIKGLTGVFIELLKVDRLDVNVQDSRCRNTALLWACSNGLTGVVIELLKVDGLDVNVQSKGGRTALIVACYYGRTDIALALLQDPRVDRHIKDRDGRSTLTLARNKALTAVVTRFEALRRGDERMLLVKVHHRYLHGDGAAEGAQAQAPQPPGSAITKTLVDKYLMHYISRFIAR